jgi:hypothetical protein
MHCLCVEKEKQRNWPQKIFFNKKRSIAISQKGLYIFIFIILKIKEDKLLHFFNYSNLAIHLEVFNPIPILESIYNFAIHLQFQAFLNHRANVLVYFGARVLCTSMSSIFVTEYLKLN